MMSNADADHPPELKRKKPLSMTPEAIRGRTFRRRRRQRIKVVPAKLRERDIEAIEHAAQYGERLAKEFPAAAFALRALRKAVWDPEE